MRVGAVSYCGLSAPVSRLFGMKVKAGAAPVERIFRYDGLQIAAQEWGDPEGIPVLALHGWLDNCGSFAPLAPMLEGIRLIAIDAPGHGMSGHRSADGTYNIWQDVAVIYDVAEQLGLSRFSLLGHSRGAMVCTLFAGTFPERVTRLGLLDTFVPIVIEAHEQAEQLAGSILDRRRRANRRAKVYPTVEALVATRLRGVTPLSELSAPYILQRGMEKVEGGYRWRSDEKLKINSEIKFTPESVRGFVERISCPILLILSDMDRIERCYGMDNFAADMSVREIKGGHHFHMEEQAPELAVELTRFYAA